ncbi:nuclear envelope integral membrane protein 1 [Nasonia vitripennis]|uniref:Nuclear envelope integral membrane protein 1 n=1 Tax=Nasonia vitripennis TaxID=7425 RepID=A0A7M7G5L6_NASVI|nr:nuclear envelope integral membrane protein 1 [Nasonia vitripennis]
MRTSTSVLAFLAVAILVCEASSWDREAVHFMEPGDWIDNDKPGLRIYCHNAKSKYIIHVWKTVVMNLRTNLETYELYEGRSPHEVVTKHEDNQKYWRFSLFNTKKSKQFRINPFEDSCIGVYMSQHSNQFQYKMIMTQNSIDTWKITMMGLGMFLFWYAGKLSRNTLFYYVSGVTIGVSLSIVILIYFLGKLLPKGKFMYVMVATGYTMSFYIAQMIWENAQLIAMQYRDYVIYYILSTALISFIICYRFGPITNTRTKNIIQWILQLFGLVLVYHSSYFREASTAFCVLLVLFYNFPLVVITKGRKYWNHIFPERRRLLTDDEYRKEGVIETKKALTGLKDYCHSPNCNPWRTVLKLKDPIRFAKFMEGECHLSENESFEHDTELTQLIEECDYTDDEFDD